ncbi:hypothetical protein ABVK25_012193 [Lepraria finkii]|uniref:Uncharacterized protein n=1 Tax=Lepraria finkii TaxID=1340010 RepID=A0ABR4APK6_9LECA
MSLPRESGTQNFEQLYREERRARQQAEQEKLQAEQEKLQAEQEKQQAEQEKQQAEQRNQKTTLDEFLQACYECLHKPLRVETHKSWTTTGGTRPGNRYYPKNLKKWENFAEEQRRVFSTAYNIFHPKNKPALRLFSPILSVEEQGRLYCSTAIANEASLRIYEKCAIEVQVADIIDHLSEIMQDPKQFQLGQGINFENDPNSLNEKAEEVQERLSIQPPRTPSPTAQPPSSSSSSNASSLESDSKPTPGRTRADQYCIYKNVGGKRELLFIVEYKPPHKLSTGDILRFRPMDVKKDALDRTRIPPPIPPDMTEKELEQSGEAFEERLQYNADMLAVAVATQTFHYMIENGLEYSYIATGEAFVFLRIDWEEEKSPTTLFYHVAVPSDDVAADNAGKGVFDSQRTAIGQVLGLCLLASESKRRTHAERKHAKKRLVKHPVTSLETLVQQTPASERKLGAKKKRAQKSPQYKGRGKVPVTSQYGLRSRYKPGDLPKNSDDEQDEQDDQDGPNSPSRPSASSLKRKRGQYGLRTRCKPGDLPKNSDDEQDDQDGPNSPSRPSASTLKRKRGNQRPT